MKNIITLIAIVSFCINLKSQTYTITTIAGNGNYGLGADGGQAVLASLASAREVAVDGVGNIYIADTDNERIRKISLNGIITTVAGTGTPGFNGDGIQATAAQLRSPWDVAVDSQGNIFIAEAGDVFNGIGSRVRKVDTNGIISTVAGNGGASGFSGDGGQANLASLNHPYGVAVDAIGNIYIADCYNSRIRIVNTNGVINTFAGGGMSLGDGGQATLAVVNAPWGVAVDATGNILIAENAGRIRKVDTNGIITTVAGNGSSGYNGDGGQATSAGIGNPTSVTVDTANNIYIADTYNHNIRKVNASGIISTIAGTGISGYNGDGGISTSAKLNSPRGIAVDGLGNVYISDTWNFRLRKLTKSCPTINITASDDTVCAGGVYTNNISGANSYSINGISVETFTFSSVNVNTYTVTGTNLGCVSNPAIITVSVNTLPNVAVNGNFTICLDGATILTAIGANSYTWNTNQNNSTITVSPSVTTNYTVTGADNNSCAAGTTVSVYVEVCTEIREKDNNNELRIYPNPADEILRVEFVNLNPNETISIHNVLGLEVLSEKTSTREINVGELPRGTYFIRVGQRIQKFIKQ